MVKELMTSNKELRNTVDQLSDANDKNQADLYHLQVENTDLRDRIEILESVIASTTHQSDFDQLDWRQLLIDDEEASTTKSTITAPALKGSSSAIKEMASELIDTKRVQRQMQLEMEQMRLQMADMQAAQMQAEQENQMLRTHSE